ncbi:MAG: DUF3179 domain-containing protein [Ilumatobacteraceae bacterium]|nr:DUF3179 domain-containing protein [Ilumatobacteraceae bacterium]
MAVTSKMRRRSTLFLLVFPLIAVACGSTGDGDSSPSDSVAESTADGETGSEDSVSLELIEPTAPDVTVSGLAIASGAALDGTPTPLVELTDLRSGGPPPDGIPSIDEPKFLDVDEVDFLKENEPVLALEVNGDVRAYPVQILTWHEIVNDTVGGIPVGVTYCPLCNSAVAYDRRIDDRVLEFGVSGLLFNSALVMFDRQTETLWSHFSGEGIVGELTGVEIETFPVATVPWGVWRDANPDGLVLGRDTGIDRPYGRNPYPGYDDVRTAPFLYEGEVDGRYTAKTRIVGVERDDQALGVPLFTLQEERVVAAELGATDLVFFWVPGTASALDANEVADGFDVGASGVFVPIVDGQSLTFVAAEDEFVDDQTGSTWNLLGQAVDGPLEGSALEAVEHVDTFWFAWSAFQPDTAIIE